MIKVDKSRYDEFIRAYPGVLSFSITGMCEPPMAGAYDFAIAKGWDALVAKHFMGTSDYWIKADD